MEKDSYIILRGILVILLLLTPIVVLYITQGGDTQTISIGELKEKAINVSYEDLRRDPNKYKDDFVRFRGLVTQAGDSFALARVCAQCTTPGYSNYAYIEIYKSDLLIEDGKEVERLIDNDQIVMWARVKGLKTYKTVLGGSNTVPLLDQVYAEIL